MLQLSHPYISIGKTMKVKVSQSCLTLCESMDWSLSGSSVHGILQARIPKCIAILFSRGSSQLRDWNQASHIAGRFFYHPSHDGSPRILEWVAYPFSSGSSRPRNGTTVSWIAGRFFTSWATRETPIVLTLWTFVSKVTSLLFTMLYRFGGLFRISVSYWVSFVSLYLSRSLSSYLHHQIYWHKEVCNIPHYSFNVCIFFSMTFLLHMVLVIIFTCFVINLTRSF